MAIITFDTLQLAAKADILKLERRLDGIDAKMDARLERIDGELKLNRWMLGILLAGVISPVMKSFFAG